MSQYVPVLATPTPSTAKGTNLSNLIMERCLLKQYESSLQSAISRNNMAIEKYAGTNLKSSPSKTNETPDNG